MPLSGKFDLFAVETSAETCSLLAPSWICERDLQGTVEEGERGRRKGKKDGAEREGRKGK
jgi:hypothetical protein